MGAETPPWLVGAISISGQPIFGADPLAKGRESRRAPIDLGAFVELQRLIITAGGNLSQVMSLVVSQALKLLPRASGAAISQCEGEELVTRACSGSVSPYVGFRLDLRTNMVWHLLTTGIPFMCMDTEEDPHVDLAACRAMGVRSMMLVPICVDGEAKGVLNIISELPARIRWRRSARR